jgi:hypothetical protein
VAEYVSLAETLGYDPAAMWALAWTLFVLRVVLGFIVGIDEIAHSFHTSMRDATTRETQARSLRRANMLITLLHIAMLAAFALAALRIPAH